LILESAFTCPPYLISPFKTLFSGLAFPLPKDFFFFGPYLGPAANPLVACFFCSCRPSHFSSFPSSFVPGFLYPKRSSPGAAFPPSPPPLSWRELLGFAWALGFPPPSAVRVLIFISHPPVSFPRPGRPFLGFPPKIPPHRACPPRVSPILLFPLFPTLHSSGFSPIT